ncbi:MAG: hypothetical protein ABH859_04575 [Pseudomonadota bacterium]
MSMTINNFPQIVAQSGLDLDLNLEPGAYEVRRRIDDVFIISRRDNAQCRFIYLIEPANIISTYSCRLCLPVTNDQSIYNQAGFGETHAPEINNLYHELDAMWQSRQISLAGSCSFSGRITEISWLRLFIF